MDFLSHDILQFVKYYFLIGIVFLGVFVFLLGIKGQNWSFKNILVVLSWPLELINLLGIILGLVFSNKTSQQPKPKQFDPSKYQGE